MSYSFSESQVYELRNMDIPQPNIFYAFNFPEYVFVCRFQSQRRVIPVLALVGNGGQVIAWGVFSDAMRQTGFSWTVIGRLAPQILINAFVFIGTIQRNFNNLSILAFSCSYFVASRVTTLSYVTLHHISGPRKLLCF